MNYRLGNSLLCFEFEGDKSDSGTVVLNVADFSGLKKRLENDGIKIVGGNSNYFKIKYPDGRSLIIEPIS